MDRFIIAPEVAKKLPSMQVVVVAAYNLTNASSNDRVSKYAEVTPTPSGPPSRRFMRTFVYHSRWIDDKS